MLCCCSKRAVVPSIVESLLIEPQSHENETVPELIDAALSTEHASELLSCLQRNLPKGWSSVGVVSQNDNYRSQVKNIVLCLEKLLSKPVEATEKHFNSEGQNDGNVSWANAKPKDLGAIIPSLIEQHCKTSLQQVADGIEKLLKLLKKYYVSSSITKGTRHDPKIFHVPSINRLLGMLCTIFFKRVVLETVDSIQKKREEAYNLLRLIRVPIQDLSMVLTPASKSLLVYLDHACEGERRVQFVVRRSSVFWDASSQAEALQLLDNLQELPCCKVFPLFVDESMFIDESGAASGFAQNSSQELMVESGEGHGPRKEFFLLAGSCLMESAALSSQDAHLSMKNKAPDPWSRAMPLFRYNRSSGTLWLNSRLAFSETAQTHYCFLGWLVAQSIFNRAPLGCPLSPVLFRRILDTKFEPSIGIMNEYDPDAAKGLQKVLEMSQNDFMAMTILEGKPSGMTQEEYVQAACQELLVDNIKWQFEAFKEGFLAALYPKALLTWEVTAEDLVEMIHGDTSNSSFDIRSAFRIVLDRELQSDYADFIKCFWDVINGWPVSKRRAFTKFVTGTDRLPLPGTELLQIEMPFVAFNSNDYQKQLQMLPQAHTCDNTLELPNYYECLLRLRGKTSVSELSLDEKVSLEQECCKVIKTRFEMAISLCTGYELDEMEETASMATPVTENNTNNARLFLKSSTRRSFFVGIGNSNGNTFMEQFHRQGPPSIFLAGSQPRSRGTTQSNTSTPRRRSDDVTNLPSRPKANSSTKHQSVFTATDQDEDDILLDNLMQSLAEAKGQNATNPNDVALVLDASKEKRGLTTKGNGMGSQYSSPKSKLSVASGVETTELAALPGSLTPVRQDSFRDLDSRIESVMGDYMTLGSENDNSNSKAQDISIEAAPALIEAAPALIEAAPAFDQALVEGSQSSPKPKITSKRYLRVSFSVEKPIALPEQTTDSVDVQQDIGAAVQDRAEPAEGPLESIPAEIASPGLLQTQRQTIQVKSFGRMSVDELFQMVDLPPSKS